MRFASLLLLGVLCAVAAGCSGSGFSPTAPAASLPLDVRARPAPASASRGTYVSEFNSSSIYGYPTDNQKDGPPACAVYDPYGDVNDIGVDGSGNLIIPDANPFEILVYSGKKLCGRWIATIKDPYGQPAGAASNDARNGTIAVANIIDNEGVNGGNGSISLCTISGGCTANLGNSNLYIVGGVVMDKNGDCWASGDNPSYVSILVYFAGCSGSGVIATGTAQTEGFGALDIDTHGNLVVVSVPGSLYVYRGCKPACKAVSGPFTLEGTSTFGHLNANATMFAAGDSEYGQVDVYRYTPKSLTYLYSFANGLSSSASVAGVAYSPRSKE